MSLHLVAAVRRWKKRFRTDIPNIRDTDASRYCASNAPECYRLYDWLSFVGRSLFIKQSILVGQEILALIDQVIRAHSPCIRSDKIVWHKLCADQTPFCCDKKVLRHLLRQTHGYNTASHLTTVLHLSKRFNPNIKHAKNYSVSLKLLERITSRGRKYLHDATTATIALSLNVSKGITSGVRNSYTITTKHTFHATRRSFYRSV